MRINVQSNRIFAHIYLVYLVSFNYICLNALLLLSRCNQWFLKRNYGVRSHISCILYSFPDSSVDLTDVMSVVDPLTKVEAGLKGTGDKAIPLQSVHIKARLLDLAAQVQKC